MNSATTETAKWNRNDSRAQRIAAIKARFPMVISDVCANTGTIVKRSI